jgi:ABC-type multidrug transport system fused ATPase/permease subunit
MAFEELKENTEEIQEQLQSYIENNLAYYKLRTFKVAMKSTTAIFKFILILLCFFMVLLFSSIALAFAIGSYFESYSYGFLTVGGIYFVLCGILYLAKEKIIEGPILEKFSEIFFND